MLVLRYVGVKVQKREAGHMVPAGLSEEVSGKKLVPFLAELSFVVKKRTAGVLYLDCLVRW